MAPIIGITAQLSADGEESSIHYGIRSQYIEVLVLHGLIPVILPIGITEAPLNEVLTNLDGILIPGGADVTPSLYGEAPHENLGKTYPVRDALEYEVIRLCLKKKKPLLAICRGMQIMNVALGGTLYQDIPTQLSSTVNHSAKDGTKEAAWTKLPHTVSVNTGTHIHNIFGLCQIKVNSLHHQGVKRLGEGLLPSAISTEDHLIEAIEYPHELHPFFVGVQWHPEMLESHKELFVAFKNACEQ